MIIPPAVACDPQVFPDGLRVVPATSALLGVHPAYELAVTNPRVCALAEASLGQGFLLSSMGSSLVRQVPTPGQNMHMKERNHTVPPWLWV